MLVLFCFFLLTLLPHTIANTEKVIFRGPPLTNIPPVEPSLEALQLQVLAPSSPHLRVSLRRSFPSKDHPSGPESWFILGGLEEGKRYEVRVCWTAIQPTKFDITHHQIQEVFDSPDLITGLSLFSEKLQSDGVPSTDSASATSQIPGEFDPSLYLKGEASILFLRIHAAADYFTTDQALMRDPPPVLVDIILDPYIANVFPKSLLPTAIYITLIAIVSWFISGFVWSWLRDISADPDPQSGASEDKDSVSGKPHND